MIETTVGVEIPNELPRNYFRNLVNSFFKILPMRENDEQTLHVYIQSLQAEILGCKSLLAGLDNNASIITLVSILQYLNDNEDCPIPDVKREVFRAISMCKKLEKQYAKAV